MTMPTLFLIRHGETAWSKTGQHTGQTDIPLTRDGEAMARELKALLAPVQFSTALASPRLRAVHTSALALPGRRVTIDPDLAEWDYGAYEGLTTAAIRTSRPDWNIFRDGCPNGETLAQVVARADRIIARVQVMDGNLAIFSHGQYGCVLAARWLRLAGSVAEYFALDPASLSVLGPKPGHPDVPAIIRWNLVPSSRLAFRNPG